MWRLGGNSCGDGVGGGGGGDVTACDAPAAAAKVDEMEECEGGGDGCRGCGGGGDQGVLTPPLTCSWWEEQRDRAGCRTSDARYMTEWKSDPSRYLLAGSR